MQKHAPSRSVQRKAATDVVQSPQHGSKLTALQGQSFAEQQTALRPGGGGYDAQKAAQKPSGGADIAREEALKAQVAEVAANAAQETVKEQAEQPTRHPFLKRIGDKIGLGLGILVTRALKHVSGWNEAVLDDAGNEVQSVPGAERVGNHTIEKRHMEYVGPIVLNYVKGLKPGRIRDFLQGFGEGAKRAPGETYRREVEAADE